MMWESTSGVSALFGENTPSTSPALKRSAAGADRAGGDWRLPGSIVVLAENVLHVVGIAPGRPPGGDRDVFPLRRPAAGTVRDDQDLAVRGVDGPVFVPVPVPV